MLGTLVDNLLVNAWTVIALAAGAALIGRFVRRPALAHIVWVVVLIKLFTPQLIELRILPERLSAAGATAAAIGGPAAAGPLRPWVAAKIGDPTLGGRLGDLVPVAARPEPARPTSGVGSPVSWREALGLLWVGGALSVLGLALARARRFRRRLVEVTHPDPALQELADRQATRLGLTRAPQVKVVRGRISPMLWSGLAGPELLMPAALAERLGPLELQALLMHELAHVARRDHWVRYLEIAATAVFWWHPVVWIARRELRRHEEQATDARVLHVLGRRRDYARALLYTLEFLAGAPTRTPAPASGAGNGSALRERLTMIVKTKTLDIPTRAQRAVMVGVAAGMLLFVPAWIEESPAAGVMASDPSGAAEELEFEEGRLQLDRQASELEQQLYRIEHARAELEQAWQMRHGAAEMDRLEAQAQELEERGRLDEANELLEQAQQARQEFEMDRERAALEAEWRQGAESLELRLRRLHIDAEQARLGGDRALADRLADEALELERELTERSMDLHQREIVLQEAELRSHLDTLRVELNQARDEQDPERTRALQREAEALQIDMERMAIEHERMRAERVAASRAEAQSTQVEAELRELQARELTTEIRALELRLSELHEMLSSLQAR